MRKLPAVLIILCLCIFSVFAADVVESTEQKKVKVTRHEPTALTLDGGVIIYVPLDKDVSKGGGIMFGGTITPVSFKKMSAGFRAEASLFAGKDILDSDSKKKELKVGFTGTCIINYPLAKSFEIYAGGGAGFILKDFDSLTEFDQTWGIVLQGGGRGRLNDRLGVGAELNLMFDIPNKTKILTALGYFSLEL